MQPFDGRKGKRLAYEIVGDLRFFCFYIGNETILSGTKWGHNYDMEIVFDPPSSALGNIFAINLFRSYGETGTRQDNAEKLGTELSSTQLIGEYIESLNNKTEFHLKMDKLQSENPKNWRDVIVRFFMDLGNRSLDTQPLKNYKSTDEEDEDDYAYWIISAGGFLEGTTAVFCNILRMDNEFNVINEEWARHRASQYIRMINDDSGRYKVIPPLKQWETTLWI